MKGSNPNLKPQIIQVKPDVKVTVPPIDIQPMADVVKEMLSRPAEKPQVDIHLPENEHKPRHIRATVTERDNRGFIKDVDFVEIVN